MTRPKWLAEPLVHFLLAGLALFLVMFWWNGSPPGERSIQVTRADLLVYLQGQAQVYDEATFAGLLEAMPAEERRQLVRDAALQKALYSEGEALGIAKADPLIQQRIVQQMRILLMEEAAGDVRINDEQLAAYYRAHRDDYRVPPQVGFTHVFFSAAEHGARAEAVAHQKLALLRRERVPFGRAGEHGDRFPYQLNYADAGQELVASHFGADFARQLFELPVGAWHGPLRSEHGWHLVLPRGRSDSRVPEFATISEQLREDALAAERNRLAQASLDRLLGKYEIVTEPRLLE